MQAVVKALVSDGGRIMRGDASESEAWQASFKEVLTHGVDVRGLNSWHVGGKVRDLFQPANLQQLSHFFVQLPRLRRFMWLGLGSNVLFPDDDLDAVIIATQKGLRSITCLPNHIIRAEVGVTCAKLARYASQRGKSQATFLAGIPGTVGGALAMNAGAFGGETWEHLVAVEVIDAKGVITERRSDEFEVSYRRVQWPNDMLGFVAGHFRFPSGSEQEGKQAISQLLKQRGMTQPIGSLSCGSVFRNPPGDHAARLIEACGLKGLIKGNAQVSEKHANFIINRGQCCSEDIQWLIDKVGAVVREQQGVALLPEVYIVKQNALLDCSKLR